VGVGVGVSSGLDVGPGGVGTKVIGDLKNTAGFPGHGDCIAIAAVDDDGRKEAIDCSFDVGESSDVFGDRVQAGLLGQAGQLKRLFHLGRGKHVAGAGFVGGLEQDAGAGDDRSGG